MLGQIISHYKIIEKLGEGGMGTVYKAEDIKLHRSVALKFLLPELTRDPEAKERFEREAQAAAALNHPHIVTIYEINEHEGHTFIAMEYVDGESIKQKIDRGPLPMGEALRLSVQVCAGLERAHGAGIIHRDIKPSNVLTTSDGRAKIVDFGLAKLWGAPQLTRETVRMGTVHYMSPEQAQGENVDARTDLWSLGVMIYEMISNRLPFVGDNPQSVLYAVVHKEPAFLDMASRAFPDDIKPILRKLLAKNPSDRYWRAQDLTSDLKRLQSTTLGRTQTIGFSSPGPAGRPQPSIAVLPFKDMSGDQDSVYFGEGLAEELINALTQLRGLRVAARTSSFCCRARDMDIHDIGRMLNVDKVLEGSVRRAGKSLRVTAQLINVEDGFHLWSERFDRKMEDVFAIQDEITGAIVDKLRVRLLEGEKEKLAKRHTENKKAYDLFLRGRYYWNRRYKGDMIKAVDFYSRAIAADPNYALAYVGIADVFNIFGQWAYIHPREAYTRSKAMLQKALGLDDTLAEAYASLSFITGSYEWDCPMMEKYARHGLELNPQYAYGHIWFAVWLMVMMKNEEGLIEAQRGIECDPLFPLAQALYGMFMVTAGSPEKGREQLLKALALGPDQPMTYLFLGMSYLIKPAVPEKGIEYLEKAVGFGLAFALGWLGAGYAMAARKDDALKVQERLEKMERENFLPPIKKVFLYLKPGLKTFRFLKKKYVAPLLKFLVAIALDEQEKALTYLEQSAANRDYFFPAVASGMAALDIPALVQLKSHPRFQALQKKIKFE
jgi:serine/threonine protein kinase/tetratricopeptide (TPR) repeat protein